jgi:hypothetical protein
MGNGNRIVGVKKFLFVDYRSTVGKRVGTTDMFAPPSAPHADAIRRFGARHRSADVRRVTGNVAQKKGVQGRAPTTGERPHDVQQQNDPRFVTALVVCGVRVRVVEQEVLTDR